MKNERSTVKSMKLSEEVISYVSSRAKEENRSFSNMVETMIKNTINTKNKEML